MDIFDKCQQILSTLQKDKIKLNPNMNEDSIAFLKEIGFNLENLNIEELQKINSSLSDQRNGLENIFNGTEFKNLKNFSKNIKDNSNLSKAEKDKLKILGITAFEKHNEKKHESCFINDSCDKTIKAHSIQENGELSKLQGFINGKQQVLHFKENIKSESKELDFIEITKASTFYGFCHKHDQIFEPIDKKIFISNEQKLFLYSYRSFSFSYHHIKSHQDNTLNLVGNLSNSIPPLIDSINNLSSSLGLNLTNELNKTKLPSINDEQRELLELVRFEKYRKFLIEYERNKIYSQLDYLTYEVNHLSPIACSSWMVMHLNFGDSYIINKTDNSSYYGYPIMISVLPNELNKTTIVLARFKFDSESKLIFNQLNMLKAHSKQFEIEISKLIFAKTENFYLQPDFWNFLDEKEKKTIIEGKNIEKSIFPEKRTEFEMINLFDEKYKLNS